MTFFRSRVLVALIGLLLVGGGSAIAAFLMTSHPAQVALVSAGGSSATTPSVTTGAAGAATATATTAPTQPAAPTARPNPTSPSAPSSGGQLVDLQGSVSSVNTSAGQFVVKATNGTSVTVVVTSSTTYQGDARSLSSLRAGWTIQVKGTPQADGTFLATNVQADSGN